MEKETENRIEELGRAILLTTNLVLPSEARYTDRIIGKITEQDIDFIIDYWKLRKQFLEKI